MAKARVLKVVNDPSAIVWGRFDSEHKTIYITGEYVKKGMLNDEIAKTIINLGLSKERIFADCAEQKSIAEIKRYGLRIEPCKKARTVLYKVFNGYNNVIL